MRKRIVRRMIEDLIAYLILMGLIVLGGLMICWFVSYLTGEQVLWFRA